MVLWGLSDEILWPHSVESSSYFRLIEQVSDWLYLKRVISKRDGCEYLKQVPSSDGSLELV
jgi:hypothetical protein